MTKQDIYNQILAVAEHLIQTKGYNAFSYRDISGVVGVKTSSIHYHFPAKEDLGKAVVQQHLTVLEEQLQAILTKPKLSCRKKLELFFDGVFAMTYRSDRRMCLGGMLASDVLTLPEIIQYEVRRFFQKLEERLKSLLSQGVEKQEFILLKDIKQEATLIVSILEGSLLLARLYQDEKRLAEAKKAVIMHLTKA